MTGPNVIDQRARDMATAATSQIQSHEKECALRWAGSMSALLKIERGMDGLYTRFWVAAVSTITMLTTACATLIYMVIDKH